MIILSNAVIIFIFPITWPEIKHLNLTERKSFIRAAPVELWGFEISWPCIWHGTTKTNAKSNYKYVPLASYPCTRPWPKAFVVLLAR
jgi:hypothetical protein